MAWLDPSSHNKVMMDSEDAKNVSVSDLMLNIIER